MGERVSDRPKKIYRANVRNFTFAVIDQLAVSTGQPPSTASKILSLVWKVSVGAYALAFIVFLTLAHLQTSGGLMGFAGFVSSLMFAVPCWLIFIVVALACTPTSFYKRDSKGRAILASTGIPNVLAMRIVMLVSAMGLAYAIYFCFKTIVWGFG